MMHNDVAVLIQGPLLDLHWLPGGYWDSLKTIEQRELEGIFPETVSYRIADFYNGHSNVIWSTWDDQDPVRIEYIKSKGIDVIENEYPSNAGSKNVFFQLHSTHTGIQHIKTQYPHIKYILKVRGDFIVQDYVKLFDYCKSNQGIGFILYRTDIHHPADYITFGSVEDMDLFYSLDVMGYDPLEFPEEAFIHHFTEKKLGYQSKSHEDTMKIGYLFGSEVIRLGLQVDWMKYAHDPLRLYVEQNICVV
jgi:hypothetical protein